MKRPADPAERSTFCILTPAAPAAIGLIQANGPLLASLLRECMDSPISAAMPESSIRRRRLNFDGRTMDDVLLLSPPGEVPVVWIGLHGNPEIVRTCAAQLRRRGFEQVDSSSELWPTGDLIDREIAATLPRIRSQSGVEWLVSQGPILRAALRHMALLAGTEPASARALGASILAGRPIVEWFAEPLRVALVGRPNAGKSTLMNRLTDSRVSIVLPTPGTTRDFVTAPGEIAGYPVEWIDTAGIRAADHPVESEGVARTRDLLQQVDVVCLLADAADPETPGLELATARPVVRVQTKIDLVPDRRIPSAGVGVSALRNIGIDRLVHLILSAAGRPIPADLRAPAAFSSAVAAAVNGQIDDIP